MSYKTLFHIETTTGNLGVVCPEHVVAVTLISDQDGDKVGPCTLRCFLAGAPVPLMFALPNMRVGAESYNRLKALMGERL